MQKVEKIAESETNRTRCAESETNRTTYPLETRGTKKSYLSKRKLSTFTAGVPYQLMGKNLHMPPGKTKIKTGLC